MSMKEQLIETKFNTSCKCMIEIFTGEETFFIPCDDIHIKENTIEVLVNNHIKEKFLNPVRWFLYNEENIGDNFLDLIL